MKEVSRKLSKVGLHSVQGSKVAKKGGGKGSAPVQVGPGKDSHGASSTARTNVKKTSTQAPARKPKSTSAEPVTPSKPAKAKGGHARRGSTASSTKSSTRKTPPKEPEDKDYRDDSRKNSGDNEKVSSVPISEQRGLGIGFEIEADAHAYANDPEYEDWSQQERDLFNQFADRGTIPLLPKTWQLDFQMMPDMFFSEDLDRVFLNTYSGKDFRAVKALSNLIALGQRVRDKLLTDSDPTPVLARGIASFYKWCLSDANLHEATHLPPLYATASAAPSETNSAHAVARINGTFREMGAFYNQRRSRWDPSPNPGHLDDLDPSVAARTTPAVRWPKSQKQRPHSKNIPVGTVLGQGAEPGWTSVQGPDGKPADKVAPTLYGTVVAKSIVAVVTYDTSAWPDTQMRNIGIFDFAELGQDVWNAFAVAIMLVTVRNWYIEEVVVEGAHEEGPRERAPSSPTKVRAEDTDR